MDRTAKMGRHMYILLLGVLLSHLGTYLVIPMLPIVLKENVHLSLAQIGSVLAANAISFQFGSLIGGYLADRIGRRFIIGLGALIGAGGLIGLGVFNQFIFLLLMAITLGSGNGLNAPSTKAFIASLASTENRTTAFSLRGIAANIGTGSAGLIIFFLVTGTSRLTFWIAGGIYLLLAALTWTFLPKKCGDEPCPPVPNRAYREVLTNKPFIGFSIVSILIWALYAQLALALPVRATEVLAQPKNVALVWTINSLIVISLQKTMTKRIINRLHPLTALAFGVLFLGLGTGSLFFATSFLYLAVSGAVFVCGEMLIMPTIDSTISQLSKADLIGLFFALSNVVSGLGDAAGKYTGGWLLEGGTTLPWVTYVLTGGILFGVVLLLKGWKPLSDSMVSAAQKENRPTQAPRVPIGPNDQESHPFNDWIPEMFLRKKPKTDY